MPSMVIKTFNSLEKQSNPLNVCEWIIFKLLLRKKTYLILTAGKNQIFNLSHNDKLKNKLHEKKQFEV